MASDMQHIDLNENPPKSIACLKVDEVPHVEFHWLIARGLVHVLAPLQGNRAWLLADNVLTMEHAKQIVGTWCAGYRFKAEELGAPAIGTMPTIITP